MSIEYAPGDIAYIEFTTQVFSTGVATNADSTPTGTVNKNGTDDGAVTVTVTNIDTGRYKAVFTIPATYVPGDVLNLTIAATVSTVAGKACIWSTKLGCGFVGKGTATAGGNATITLQTALGADNRGIGCILVLVAGTGSGQAGVITGYVNSTKVVTVGRNWVTNPDNTTVYAILYCDSPKVDSSLQTTFGNTSIATVTTVTNQLTAAAIATGVWQDTTAGDFTVALSIGKSVMNGVTLGTGLTINGYTGNTIQTGDSFARLGVAGVGLTNLGDTRIANLDATVTSRTKPADTQAAVTLVATTTNLTNAPTVGDLTAAMKASVTAAVPTSAQNAAATEAAILNEGDATALLAAIAAKVEEFLVNDGDASATLAAIAAAVRTNLTTELGRIDAAISTRATPAQVNAECDTSLADYDGPTNAEMVAAIGTPMQAGTVVLTDGSLTTAKLGTFVLAKTTNISGFNDIAATAIVSSGAITTSAGKVSGVVLVDACTLNSDMRGTNNALLASSYAAPDNAGIAAIQAQTDDLTFTIPGVLDSRVHYVHNTEVKGSGIPGDTWGPV